MNRGKSTRPNCPASPPHGPQGAALLLACLFLAPGSVLAATATADDPERSAAERSGSATPAPVVPLDRLFELPSGFEPQKRERRGRVGENEWRSRFAEARSELEAAQAKLRVSKAELSDLAESSSSWSVAPPVGGNLGNNTDAPLSYELSQRIKREDRAVQKAKRHLLDLEVEANLASVPEFWRQ